MTSLVVNHPWPDVSIPSETLAPEEVADITGRKLAKDQAAWLDENGWMHHKNHAGAPIVGRWYARLRLAGITPQATTSQGWAPDFYLIK